MPSPDTKTSRREQVQAALGAFARERNGIVVLIAAKRAEIARAR